MKTFQAIFTPILLCTLKLVTLVELGSAHPAHTSDGTKDLYNAISYSSQSETSRFLTNQPQEQEVSSRSGPLTTLNLFPQGDTMVSRSVDEKRAEDISHHDGLELSLAPPDGSPQIPTSAVSNEPRLQNLLPTSAANVPAERNAARPHNSMGQPHHPRGYGLLVAYPSRQGYQIHDSHRSNVIVAQFLQDVTGSRQPRGGREIRHRDVNHEGR